MLGGGVSSGLSAAAVLELAILSDGQFGGVAWWQAIAQVGGAATTFHLRQCRYQPRVCRVQRADPLLLIGQRQGDDGTGIQIGQKENDVLQVPWQ